MQCEQLQQRLDDLLDRREDVRSDAQIASHAAACVACERLVGAYESMLLGIDLLGGTELEDQFVSRTVDSMDRRRRRAALGRRILAAAAIGAAVLVAVGISGWWDRGPASGESQRSHADRRAERGIHSAAHVAADSSPQAVAKVLHATGRNLATLPATVRRVAAHPKTNQIVGPMRPLAEPFGATWEVLLRACSGGPTPATVIPEADTGYIHWQRMQHV